MKRTLPLRRPIGLRRSWMFVPGLDVGAQNAALVSLADALVADLEEFTHPQDRPAARQRITALLPQCRMQGVIGAVRINKLDGDGLEDLQGVMAGAPDAIFLPHTETPDQITALDDAISACERTYGLVQGSTEIIPTLESAAGLVHAYAILTASTRVSACLLAAEDLSASLGNERGVDGIELHAVRARFLVDCTAAGCLAIDCPFNFHDDLALEADLRWARRLGLKSKCATLSEQIGLIHRIFTPQIEEVEAAQRYIELFETQQTGSNVTQQRIDPPIYHTARRLLTRHAEFERWAARHSNDQGKTL